MMSWRSSQTSAPISRSPSSRPMAILPLLGTFTKSASSFRRTLPRAVAKKTLIVFQVLSSSGSGITALMLSP